MVQLAIKGHASRGKEVIEILEMLGGTNVYHHRGGDSCVGYTIEENEIRNIPYIFGDEDFKFLSIEEFYEKYPYKVGDKVKYINNLFYIKSSQWDYDKNTVIYYIDADWSAGYVVEASDLQPYKEETMEDIIKIDIPKGYEFAGVNDDEQQVVFTKILSRYPKTYEECCDILNIETNRIIDYDDCLGYRDITQYDTKLLTQLRCLRKILICRDAYWKLYGEQMGLGKPWKPNWNDGDEEKYCIEVRSDDELCDITYLHAHRILAFPTMELLDIFGEYFKDLIEQCKELL